MLSFVMYITYRQIWLSAVAALAALLAAPAQGQVYVAYQNPDGLIGIQGWSGTLGMQFTVNSPILVTALGIFDSGADGLVGTLNTNLWSVNDMVTPLASMTFTAAMPGTLDAGGMDGSSRFLPLLTPLRLDPGDYVIAADSFSSDDPNANEVVQIKTWTTNDGGGLITFDANSPYDSSPGVFPTIPYTNPNGYAAGTFQFTSAVPEPGEYALMMGAAALGLAGWRRRRARR